ncbi:MAG: hypothetical protein CVV41_15025 [Candidatus Riflebacteria bacterium HGW-Riflebacteria-1]|jgi:hypothetical protein|nr:MAG: hypothetical protein CVV41_15025 [Candidatus Riflebacteria bacterium HGW-Riflebacteria-1]
MGCNKLETWLESNNFSDKPELPKELKEHMNSCTECHDRFEIIHSFRSAVVALKPSENTRKRAWNGIKQSLPAPSQVQAGTTVSESWLVQLTKVFGQFGMKHALAMTMVMVAALGLFFMRTPRQQVPSQLPADNLVIGSLTGTGATLRNGLEEAGISDQPLQFAKDSYIAADSKDSAIMLAFADGSKVDMAGRCQIQIGEQGFTVKNGDFTGNFTLNPGSIQKVVVPGAVLNIVGTKIRFMITGKSGKLDLLEGSVNVETPSKLATFAWHAGSRIIIEDGSVTDYPTEIPVAASSSSGSSPGTATGVSETPVDDSTSQQNQNGSQGQIINIDNILKD